MPPSAVCYVIVSLYTQPIKTWCLHLDLNYNLLKIIDYSALSDAHMQSSHKQWPSVICIKGSGSYNTIICKS